MPDTIRIERQLFRLNGVAVYRKFGIPVLVAGLWLDHEERDATKILAADAPRRYVSHFLHRAGSERICKAWREGLEANTPHRSEAVRQQFQTLCGWIRDFRPGDEITLTYMPGRGSTVEISGVRKGTIPGKEFADAYFACALGPRPGPGEGFKKRLLGRP